MTIIEDVHFPSVQFVKSATKPSQYPPPLLPEIAVAGRSNVGKSSLLNSLFNHKKMVQVSKTPGRTRLINFFNIEDKIMMVDLPGYGYAKVAKSMKKDWQPMIEKYLIRRDSLVGVLLLLDIRRNPSQQDLELWHWFHHFHQTVIPVLTKGDKLSAQKRKNQVQMIAKKLDVPKKGMLVTSAKDHFGRDQLRESIKGLCWGFQPPSLDEDEEAAT